VMTSRHLIHGCLFVQGHSGEHTKSNRCESRVVLLHATLAKRGRQMSARKGKAPGFFWYPKDVDTDEAVCIMEDAEYGFYCRCLNHSWINDGLPGDLEKLAKILGKTKKYV